MTRQLIRSRRVDIEAVALLLGLLIVATCVVLALGAPTWHDEVQVKALLAFGMAIVLGEWFVITIPGVRDAAPISIAASYACAMTTWSLSELLTFSTAVVVAACGGALLLGSAISRMAGHRVHYVGVLGRLVGVLTVSMVYCTPVFGGKALLLLDAGLLPRWAVAIIMLAASTVGLVADVTVTALLQAYGSGAPRRRLLVDHMRATVGLSLAMSATGTLIALAEKPLGSVAVPLFLIPLALTQFAARRYALIRETYDQTIRTLSRLTEMAGYTPHGHSSRVAALAVAVGRDLGLAERSWRHLEYAALLHDIGQVGLADPLPSGATVLAAPRDQRRIAVDGAHIVRQTGVLDEVANIIEVQSTPFRVVRECDEELAIEARIVKVVNDFDDLVGDSESAAAQADALERLQLGLGYEYDPRVVDALARVLERRSGAPLSSVPGVV